MVITLTVSWAERPSRSQNCIRRCDAVLFRCRYPGYGHQEWLVDPLLTEPLASRF